MAVTNQELFNIFLANPNMSDAQIVSLMETRGISPEQISSTFNIPVGDVVSRVAATIPEGMSVTLGDTRIAPQYEVRGSGEDRQVVGIENITVEKTTGDINYKSPVGSEFQNYSPTGEFTGTGKVTSSGDLSFFGGLVDMFKDPVVLAALAGGYGAGLFGGAGALGGAATVGTTGLTAAELALADLSLGGAGGTLGAETLASALTSGAAVPTLTNLTGGSGVLTGAAGGITAESVAAKLAADAATPGLLTPPVVTPPVVPPVVPPTTVPPVVPPTTVPPVVTKTAAELAAEKLASDAALKVAAGVGTNLLTKSGADAVSGLLQTTGSLVQSQESKDAAIKAAQDITKATQTGVEGSQFRPVGMTTRFGTSNYTYDPVTGRMTSAGYQLSPEAKNAQDRLVRLAESGLQQAEGARGQFAPLQTGAQNLFGLGNQYISQSPQDVAQNYINQQMQLLQPSREMELANLQNRLQQQGRAGLSVAQGGSLGATTPELQALYNARAQQELQLAAGAQQAGQQNVLFGAGLLGQGATAMGNYYGGQQAAYSPYTTALGQVQALEGAAQQPLQMGANLAQQASAAGARSGMLGLEGQRYASAFNTGANATFNPYAGLLTAAGNPSSMFGQAFSSLFSPTVPPVTAMSAPATSYGAGNYYGNQDVLGVWGT